MAEQSEPQTKETPKEIKTKTGSRGKRREQNDRAIRGILGTLNKKLKRYAQDGLGEQDFARYVELAIQLRKTIGKPPSLKDRQAAERPSKQDLF